MRKLFFLFAFCLMIIKILPGQAQDLIESLRAKVDASADDLVRVENTYQLIAELSDESLDASLTLAEENLQLAKEVANNEWLAKCYWQLGQMFYAAYQDSVAIANYKQALNLASQYNYLKIQADVLIDLAAAFYFDEQQREGIEVGLKSIPIYLSLRDLEGLAGSYLDLGIYYKQWGDTDTAKWYLNKSMNLADSGEFKAIHVRAMKVSANILADEGNDSEALTLYQEALKSAEEENLISEISSIFINLAILHKDLKDYSNAEYYYMQCLVISQKHAHDKVHSVQYNLGVLYLELQDKLRAISYLRQALTNQEKMGLKRKQLKTAVILAEAYHLMGNMDSTQYYVTYGERLLPEVKSPDEKATAYEQLAEINVSRGKYNLAQSQFLKAYRLYTKLNITERVSWISKSLYELYKEKGEHEQSLAFLEKHFQLEDSLFSEEKIREITKLEEGYKHEKEILKKENELELLEAKDQLRLQLFIGVALIVLITGFFVARTRIKAKSLRAKQLEEIGNFKEAMTGMIAHDLKNPLSVILNSPNADKNQYTARQMLQLINNMLDVQKFESTKMQLNLEMTDLKSLVQTAREQVEIQAQQANVQVVVDMPQSAVSLDKTIMERVLVNLLTNAIKYSPLNSEVVIKGEINGNHLMLFVSDYGKGIPKEHRDLIFESFGQSDPKMAGGIGSTGLGLTFCKLAVEAHGSELLLDSELGKGTTFSFELQLIEEGDKTVSVDQDQKSLKLSPDQQKQISACIPVLKTLNLYQISEIEKVLTALKEKELGGANDWADEVLDAAYAGNAARYQELLKYNDLT